MLAWLLFARALALDPAVAAPLWPPIAGLQSHDAAVIRCALAPLSWALAVQDPAWVGAVLPRVGWVLSPRVLMRATEALVTQGLLSRMPYVCQVQEHIATRSDQHGRWRVR